MSTFLKLSSIKLPTFSIHLLSVTLKWSIEITSKELIDRFAQLCSPIDIPVSGSHTFTPEIQCIYFAGIVVVSFKAAKDKKGHKAQLVPPATN